MDILNVPRFYCWAMSFEVATQIWDNIVSWRHSCDSPSDIFLMKENINNSRRSSVALTSCFQHRPGSTAEIMKSIMRCWFITLHHHSQQNSGWRVLNVWCTLNGRPQSTGSKHWLRAERLKNGFLSCTFWCHFFPIRCRSIFDDVCFIFLLQMFYT